MIRRSSPTWCAPASTWCALNFSHGAAADHARRVDLVREAAERAGRYVGVLGDLQGPKIRIDRFAAGKVELVDGAEFTLDASLAVDAGDEPFGRHRLQEAADRSCRSATCCCSTTARSACRSSAIDGPRIKTRVLVGGELGNNKGINRQGGGLSAGALTDKDREDIAIAAALKVDYLAVSFARDAADMNEARSLLRAAGGQALHRRQDRARGGDQEPGRGGAGERRRHGRARRSRRRDGISPSWRACRSRSSTRRAIKIAWSSRRHR